MNRRAFLASLPMLVVANKLKPITQPKIMIMSMAVVTPWVYGMPRPKFQPTWEMHYDKGKWKTIDHRIMAP